MQCPERDPDRVHAVIADVLDHDTVRVPGALHDLRRAARARLHDDDAGRVGRPAKQLEGQLGDR